MWPGGLWIEHRVVDDQLAAPFEYLAYRLPAFLALKRVLLLDQLPRQIATFLVQLIANPGELLFLAQMILSGCHTFIVRYYPV